MKKIFGRILIVLLLLTKNFYPQSKTVDSLKLALKTANHDTIRCFILNQLVETTSENEWPVYNEQMGTLAKKNLEGLDKKDIQYPMFAGYLANMYGNKGYLAHTKGDLTEAIAQYEAGLKIIRSVGFQSQEATMINNIGFAYMDQGDIPKALDYFGKCLALFEKVGDKKGIAGSLNNIGFVYDGQGDKKKALDYYKRSLAIKEEIGDHSGMAFSLNNIGSLYQIEGKYEEALECFTKSLNTRKYGVDKAATATTLNNLGSLYREQGDLAKALDYHDQSLKLLNEIGDRSGISETYLMIGEAYYELKQVKKALEAGNRSLEVGKEIGFPERIRHAAYFLYEAYQLAGDYKSALRNHELYIQMRDSVNNQTTQKAAIRSQFKIEYELKEQQARSEREKIDIKNEEERQKQAIIRNSFIGGFVLVLILAIVILRSFLQNKRKNALIEHQKQLVEQKQKEIIDSIQYAQRIQRALMPSEGYFSRIMDRLKK